VLFKKIIIIICGEFKKKMTIGGGGRWFDKKKFG
jgi:hypothetical protein